jgi:tetratricopeptide (TPR) repeat protein
MKKIVFGAMLSSALALSGYVYAAGEPSSNDGGGTPSKPTTTNNDGSGGGSGADTPVKSAKKLKCKKNEVIKKMMKKGSEVLACVKVNAGILPDEDLYQQGRLLAKEGEYDWAITVLSAISNQNDPRVLNYTGYSHRKAGRLDTGITFYRKALSINPNFVLAREYLGEGYVAAGRIDLAKVELTEIGNRCGVTCDEYKALEKAIVTGVN